MKRLSRLVAFVLVLASTYPAWGADEIVIGQTADFSSVAGQQMKDFNAGALAYFGQINARGGIKGRSIRLEVRDDAFSADKATANARELIEKSHVVALFGSRGTDPSEAVMKVAEASKVALVAPITGADSVRESAYTFPVRASYRDEVATMLTHLSFVPARLALVIQDDKFGNPLAAYIDSAVRQKYRNTTIVARVKFPRKQPDLKVQAQAVLNAEPTAVIALCNPTSCESLVRNLYELAKAQAKPRPTVYQTSISDMYSQFKKLGPDVVSGNPFSQVLPDPNRGVSPLVKEYRAMMTMAKAPLNYRSYEGYFSAAVLVEALKRSHGATRADLVDALEQGMSKGVEFGDVTVSYASGAHQGSSFVDLVTIDRGGRLVH
jgi:branched-chain amino acid transport system substrate-binding protein